MKMKLIIFFYSIIARTNYLYLITRTNYSIHFYFEFEDNSNF